MKRVCWAILPGGLLVAAALGFLRPAVLPDWMHPYVRAYPYVVAAAGVLLGWLFNRSRVVFAILVLAAADQAVAQFAPAGGGEAGAGDIVFDAVAQLLPLNLAAFAMVRERGILTAPGITRLLVILGQCLAVAVLVPGLPDLEAWLEHRFVQADLAAWTPVPQPALLAFGLALLVQGVRVLVLRSAIEGGFLWALVASFVALQGVRAGWLPTNYFATAGLVLVVAVFETTYRMAYHDDLTGLPGRRALSEALLKLGSRYAVAMVDIDHFKQFNDRYGHEVGDQVLRMVAAKLERVSGGGKAFRYGGEEFAVIFPALSAEEAVSHLDGVRKAVQATCFVLRGPDRPRKKPRAPKPPRSPRRAVVVTISIGVAERDERHVKPDQVVKAADVALYRAKEAGRNQVRM